MKANQQQKLIRSLEAENKKLQRQVSRLQSRIEHIQGREFDLEELEEELAVSLQNLRQETAPPVRACECGCAEFVEIRTPTGKVLEYCKDCHKKQAA